MIVGEEAMDLASIAVGLFVGTAGRSNVGDTVGESVGLVKKMS